MTLRSSRTAASAAHLPVHGCSVRKRCTLVPTENRNQIATLLYNQMIHPLLPLAIRGVIWYQGEANAAERMRSSIATSSRR